MDSPFSRHTLLIAPPSSLRVSAWNAGPKCRPAYSSDPRNGIRSACRTGAQENAGFTEIRRNRWHRIGSRVVDPVARAADPARRAAAVARAGASPASRVAVAAVVAAALVAVAVVAAAPAAVAVVAAAPVVAAALAAVAVVAAARAETARTSGPAETTNGALKERPVLLGWRAEADRITRPRPPPLPSRLFPLPPASSASRWRRTPPPVSAGAASPPC